MDRLALSASERHHRVLAGWEYDRGGSIARIARLLWANRWGVVLAILSFVALLPWSPQGPFDARDYGRLADVHLEYPLSGTVLEPVLAPAQILAGAPDFRLALLSTTIWIVGVALLAGALTGRGIRQRAGRAFLWAALAVGGLCVYMLFVAMVHLPGWRLTVDDPNVVVADLHSHTFGSHDGLVTAEENLRWHQARGYHVVAITEHKTPMGAFAAQEIAQAHPDLPGVIPGVEVPNYMSNHRGYLLGLGLRSDRPVLLNWNSPQKYTLEFVRNIHEAHGGVVVALSWLLEPHHISALAADGIDGIELVNSGHPNVPEAVREAMLGPVGKRLALVASTDWHGWSGFTRTWTLVHIPGAAAMDNAAKAHAVTNLLRTHNTEAFTPVVAGHIGPPSTLRLIFTPIVELVRYAAELSPERLLSWWAWVALAMIITRRLRARGLRPAWLGTALAAAAVGGALTVRAVALLTFGREGTPHEYAIEMGQWSLVAGVAALTAAALLVWLEWRRSSARRLGSTSVDGSSAGWAGLRAGGVRTSVE